AACFRAGGDDRPLPAGRQRPCRGRPSGGSDGRRGRVRAISRRRPLLGRTRPLLGRRLKALAMILRAKGQVLRPFFLVGRVPFRGGRGSCRAVSKKVGRSLALPNQGTTARICLSRVL